MRAQEKFSRTGFVWKRGIIPKDLLELPDTASSRNMNLSSDIVSICQTALSEIMPGAFPTRATLFAKSGNQAWSLGWHQDRVIAVAEKHHIEGYTNWTLKDGIWHVEPPLGVLEKMIFVQVYFCLLYTSPSPRDKRQSRMPSSA